MADLALTGSGGFLLCLYSPVSFLEAGYLLNEMYARSDNPFLVQGD